jgi:hypothetical protein
MLPPLLYKTLIALPFTVALTSCFAKTYIVQPPSPTTLPSTPPSLSPVTESSISFPVQMNLTPFLNAVNDETVMPKTFDHVGNPLKHSKNMDHRHSMERDEFTLAQTDSYQSTNPDQGAMLRDWWKGVDLPGSRLSVTSDFRYHLGTHSQTPNVRTPGDCSNGREQPKRATVDGGISIGMTPNYGVAASVSDVAINASDPCNPRVTTIELAQEVRSKLTGTVRGGLNHAVATLSESTVRSHVEDAWNALRKPIPLEPNTWLLLNIERVKHAGFSIAGQSLDDTMHIVGKPVIVFGAEPPAAAAALPQLDTQPATPGFHVVADIPLDYASLSKSVAARLRDKRVSVKGDFIRITDAALFGLGGNQVLLKLMIGGDANGHLYFVGKPEMNTLTQTVQISGLRLETATEQLLQKEGPDWLYHSPLRELVVDEAVIGIAPAIDRVRDLHTKALNRTLTPAITTHGTIASVQGIGVFADVNALYIRVMSDGSLNLKVAGKP